MNFLDGFLKACYAPSLAEERVSFCCYCLAVAAITTFFFFTFSFFLAFKNAWELMEFIIVMIFFFIAGSLTSVYI